MTGPGVAALYVRWTGLRSFFHRGWWLVASLYLVVEAGLTPLELVALGTLQGIATLLCEVPTGVLADTVSRKASLLVAHVLMGAGMLATGLVTSFPALAAAQMIWGISWTFASGADVAWLTDEMARPERVSGVIARSDRFKEIGAAAGMVGLGGLAWLVGLSTAIVVAGLAIWGLGLWVGLRFPERNFRPAAGSRRQASWQILRRGLRLARGERRILVVFAATVLVNGAAEAVGRLFPKRLIDLGLGGEVDPIVWLTGLGLVARLLSALALRGVEARIDAPGADRRAYALACAVGTLGALALAFAPTAALAICGVWLLEGVTWSVTRTVGVIQVNRRTTSDVRATVHSLLGQAEYGGEITLGFGLGLLAQAAGIPAAMVGAAGLLAATVWLVWRER